MSINIAITSPPSRPRSNFADVPGCIAGGIGDKQNDDYCYLPPADMMAAGNGANLCSPATPCAKCRGACTTNADCVALDEECGGDCGDCTLTQTRSCFVDPIAVSGVADTQTPLGVSTFCIPPTSNVGINEVSGLPGPSRTLIQLRTLRNFF